MNDKIEILAPAGNMENLVAAVRSGANAVYLGVQAFNARASADNFDYAQLKNAVSYAHARNVKVNVTLNTILYDNELEEFKQAVMNIAKCGVDAVIVQDLAAAQIVKSVAPTMSLHASTQMAVHTLEGALLLKENGYSRVILSRELPIEQIRYITENCGIETEIFVHGALCVSLSGQCYASAFLGGRSGNRGRCAGTCRLPMSACGDMEDNHLSLKDLSAIDMLPEIEEIGVKCVKIEGRLRTPEYVASAVDSVYKSLKRQEYDKQLLNDAFSRSGFTNAFLDNKLDNSAFGVRTKEDTQKTKIALPQIRQIYRREGQFVPIDISFDMGETVSALTISDGIHEVSENIEFALESTDNDLYSSINTALNKLGGTPFCAKEVSINIISNKYLPISLISKARKVLTDKLMVLREKVVEHKTFDYSLPKNSYNIRTPKFIAKFSTFKQLNINHIDKFEYIILPIDEILENYNSFTSSIKEKVVAELPRGMFTGTKDIQSKINNLKSCNFNKFCINNIGQIPLVENSLIISDFTLNISNSVSAKALKKMGVNIITISPEIKLEQIKAIDSEVKTAIIGFGNIPLMLTRACPLHNIQDCKNCNKTGFLTDRKNMQLPVVCNGGLVGYREIFNPIPIYMGDRLNEMSADYINLMFTTQTTNQIDEIVDKFLNNKPYGKDFTRGLYYKASI